MTSPTPTLLSAGVPRRERLALVLRQDRFGGALLVLAAVLALVLANSGWADSYTRMQAVQLGPQGVHLHLSLAQWAADGLLAIFFFVAGLELKRECVEGDLRHLRRALLPVAAAVGGMVCPALVFLALAGDDAGLARGWAIPTPTDIAFALAVLAVIGRHLPASLRMFVLAVAVVDDVLAITIIALFFTASIAWIPAVAALVGLAVFAWLVRRRVCPWPLVLPVALVVWALVHASGIHATVAGVLLGVVVPVVVRDGGPGKNVRGREREPEQHVDLQSQHMDLQNQQGHRPVDHQGPSQTQPDKLIHPRAQQWEHWWRPISACVALPLFALTSAGVAVGGMHGLGQALGSRVTLAVVAGLVVGKTVGILGAIALMNRLARVRLDPALGWWEYAGVAALAGMGFTVSLLLAQLSFGPSGLLADQAKVGVLAGSVCAALLSALVLGWRNRVHRQRLHAQQAAP